MAEPLRNIVDPGWAEALEPVEGRIAAMGEFLRAEVAAGRRYLPSGGSVLRAFKQPFADVRVLIVGQDPYPTPGHPVGLSFSVAPDVRRLPPSLVNIFTEYSADLGYPAPANGDLTPWSERGVLLLNRVLTVRPGKPGSHRGKGWEEVTEQAIRALAARKRARKWHRWSRSCGATTRGRWSRCSAPAGDTSIGCIESAHPSPVFGQQRVLRIPSVQPRQSAPRTARRRAGRLETALAPAPARNPKDGWVTPAVIG